MKTVQVTYAGRIEVKRGETPKELYSHQNEAIKALNETNKNAFEGLLVLPTGGGKTLTAVHWLLRNFINHKKKVLWIAHRHELLDQALETLQLNAYSSLLSNVSGFRYRIIINSIWNDEKSFWQVIFSYNQLYFMKQLDDEIRKITNPDIYGNVSISIPSVIPDTVPIEKLTLYEIKERDILEYRKIKNAVFAKHTDAKGFITCAISGVKSQMRRDFQIDHIKPMSQGGLTTIDNLQLLTRKAHIEKTRRENIRR